MTPSPAVESSELQDTTLLQLMTAVRALQHQVASMEAPAEATHPSPLASSTRSSDVAAAIGRRQSMVSAGASRADSWQPALRAIKNAVLELTDRVTALEELAQVDVSASSPAMCGGLTPCTIVSSTDLLIAKPGDTQWLRGARDADQAYTLLQLGASKGSARWADVVMVESDAAQAIFKLAWQGQPLLVRSAEDFAELVALLELRCQTGSLHGPVSTAVFQVDVRPERSRRWHRRALVAGASVCKLVAVEQCTACQTATQTEEDSHSTAATLRLQCGGDIVEVLALGGE